MSLFGSRAEKMQPGKEAALRVGVVGTGHLGSVHAKLWTEVPGASLSGVYDIDQAAAARAAKETGSAAHPSLEALLSAIDAVSIVVPTSVHAEIAETCIASGKHVFIEKPIAATAAEAERIIALAAAKQLVLQVGHIERFNPAILALEKFILTPMFVESHRLSQFSTRSTDVDVVLDLMIHDIDIILSLVRSPVAGVEASGVGVVSDTIDIANARLRFESGCVANVTASRISQKKMRKMRMFQRDAYISVDFLECSSEIYRLVNAGDPGAGRGIPIPFGTTKKALLHDRPKIPRINPLKYELERFLEAVTRGTPPPVTGEDGLSALNVAHTILETIRNQR